MQSCTAVRQERRRATQCCVCSDAMQSMRPQRSAALRDSDRAATGTRVSSEGSGAAAGAQHKREGERTMGGLPLPDVVRELLRDPAILKWHPREEVYEVTHGDNFEKRCGQSRAPRWMLRAWPLDFYTHFYMSCCICDASGNHALYAPPNSTADHDKFATAPRCRH